jgi:molybdate transport system substrate-binding protein
MRRIATLLLSLLAAAAVQAAEVSVAVAANFTAPMQKIAAAFERDTGHRAVLAFGSTGRFYAQIRNGAPFQVLLAADDETPARLEKEGAGGRRIALHLRRRPAGAVERRPGVVDAQGEVLKQPGTGKVAIADPKLAPYGAAAVQVMDRLGVTDQLRPRLVQGESIGQAFQFVGTGNAPLGFVALSQVMVDGRIEKGSAWIVPATLHDPLKQDAVLLKPARTTPPPPRCWPTCAATRPGRSSAATATSCDPADRRQRPAGPLASRCAGRDHHGAAAGAGHAAGLVAGARPRALGGRRERRGRTAAGAAADRAGLLPAGGVRPAGLGRTAHAVARHRPAALHLRRAGGRLGAVFAAVRGAAAAACVRGGRPPAAGSRGDAARRPLDAFFTVALPLARPASSRRPSSASRTRSASSAWC